MTVRNLKLNGPSDFTAESPTFQDINDTNDSLARVSFDSDSTGSNNTSGTTTHATLSITAGSCERYVEVFVTFNADYQTSGLTNSSANIKIDIGESGSEVEVLQRTVLGGASDGTIIRGFTGGVYRYYYEPTTDEKNNGFNVLIKSVATAGSGTVQFQYRSSQVIGS